jgi:serine/threonine protein kinase
MKDLNVPEYKLYWFTGQPGAGKTTLALELKSKLEDLHKRTKKVVILDGDEIRDLFNNKDYSPDGRLKNVEMVQNCCRFLVKNEIIHNDIKYNNILINTENVTPVIIDFGLSIYVKQLLANPWRENNETGEIVHSSSSQLLIGVINIFFFFIII